MYMSEYTVINLILTEIKKGSNRTANEMGLTLSVFLNKFIKDFLDDKKEIEFRGLEILHARTIKAIRMRTRNTKKENAGPFSTVKQCVSLWGINLWKLITPRILKEN